MAQILLIEDEELLGKSICRALRDKNHESVTFTSAEEGLEYIKDNPTDLILLDIQLPGISGLEALQEIKKFDPSILVIITSAYATMTSVVEALRFGASDFLRKPLDIDEVVLAVERSLSDSKLKQKISYYHDIEVEKTEEDKLVINSSQMKEVCKIIDSIASMDLPSASEYPPVLLLGETGVGKDLLARIIHFHGKLSQEPFIEVNCTTLPKGLEEAELFGYDKGAFTGADRSKIGLFDAASGGTIFLNEIGDLSISTQVKLLQVIEQKCIRRVGGLKDIKIDVRVIAATHRDLKDSKEFRSDLYYRLNNLTVNIPPLRERKDDIIELSEFFLSQFGKKYHVQKNLTDSAKKVLLNYNWPGNVRELRQIIERVTFLKDSQDVTAEHFNFTTHKKTTGTLSFEQMDFDFPEEGINIEEVEKSLIVKALQICDGNVSKAARKLSLSREALRYRIKKYEIFKIINIIG